MSYPVAFWCVPGLRADGLMPRYTTAVIEQMSRHDIEVELVTLRARVKDLTKRSRQYANIASSLKDERHARVAAENNAKQFHALLLRARVDLIRARKETA